MPLNELPKFFGPETLTLMETALEKAWQELRNDRDIADANSARGNLAKTITALASVGETTVTKLEQFALQASRRTSNPAWNITAWQDAISRKSQHAELPSSTLAAPPRRTPVRDVTQEVVP
jgi:hypothetical protein